MKTNDPFVAFAPHVVFRGLEKPHLFNLQTDELYELDEEGLLFVEEIDGTRRRSEIKNRNLLAYAEAEGLLEFAEEPNPRALARGSSPRPSLRYLELIITRRCNLKCAHCYLGDPETRDMEPGLLRSVLDEFDEMQGLRVLLSGGEPLLYPHQKELFRALSGRSFRSVLLTNGLLLSREFAESLPVQEVQLSLDGMEEGHEALRGAGTFRKALRAARLVRESGKDLSIATMIHPANLQELDRLEELVHELGAKEWSLDLPAVRGRWRNKPDLNFLEQAAKAMSRGFGESFHGSSPGFACGYHLAAVMPSGAVCQCGFYEDRPFGNAREGLRKAWQARVPLSLQELSWCRECPAAEDCRGGCRFRAGGDGPDLLMCAAFGWPRGAKTET